MKRVASIFVWAMVLFVGGCTRPHFGVSLRFQRADPNALRNEVHGIAADFGFTDEWSGLVKHGDREVILSMRGKSLTLVLVQQPVGLTVGVGRPGGLGLSLRSGEIALIRALCAKLQALAGYAGVEREVGMRLVDDQAEKPPPKPTAISPR